MSLSVGPNNQVQLDIDTVNKLCYHGEHCYQGRVAAAYIEKLGTFRFDYEYEIENKYDF